MVHYHYLVNEFLGFAYGGDHGNHPLVVFKTLKSALKYAKFIAKNHLKENDVIKKDNDHCFKIYNKKTKETNEDYECYITKIRYYHTKVPKKKYEHDLFFNE
jgi:hypothetical protein